jgi:hypothetical protein
VNIFIKNDVVRPALLASLVLALHLIILSWVAGLQPTASAPLSPSEHFAPPLTVRIVEPSPPPIAPDNKAEPPPSKVLPARKRILARPRPSRPTSQSRGILSPSEVPPAPVGQGDTYQMPDDGLVSGSQSSDNVDPKLASGVSKSPSAAAGHPDTSQALDQDTPAAKPADAVKPEQTVEPDRRGVVASEAAFSYQFAPFPRPTLLAYAVHAPKDYRESSGSSGTAELRTEVLSTPNGPDQFAIKVEISLSWLLKRMVGGTLNYESRGQIGLQGLQVGRYSEKIGERAPRWLEVDIQKSLMKSFSVTALGVPPMTQDRLSIIWLLGMMARADPAQLEKGKVFSMPMFTFRQTYSGRFESMGNEVLESPAGILQSLHVAYMGQDVGGDKVDIWLGYDYEMQPVRIRWEEAQGRVIDLILLKKPK